MPRLATLLAATAMVVTAGTALAQTPTFQTIDNPADPTFNQILAIDNNGNIAGYFGSGAAGHPNQSYLSAAPYTAFTPANVQGAVQTQITAFSGSTLAGFWSGTDFGLNSNNQPQDANYGFIGEKRASGKYQVLTVNGQAAGVPATARVLGINSAMRAAGFYTDATGLNHGFIYHIPSATYTEIKIKGSISVTATSINASNLVAGFYQDQNTITHAFLVPLAGGTPIIFTVPGAAFTEFLGVNSNGEAVGIYQLTPNDITHGLLYNPANGQWHTLDDPNGVFGTVINGLNDKGQAVGYFIDAAGNFHGMVITNAF